MPKPVRSLRVRFDEKWVENPVSGCWEWTASLNRTGYGQIAAGRGKSLLAHRNGYELYIGPIPEGLQLDHLCRNRKCVNPAHLEPVTNKENSARGIAPEVTRARLLALTHCKHGHPLSGDNLYLAPKSGQRICVMCRLTRKRASNALRPKKGRNLTGLELGAAISSASRKARTHCKNGHPWDEANTLVYRNNRVCRACHAARQRERQTKPKP